MNPGTGELLSSGAVFEERYRIERLLGVGGTAAVYLAHDLQLEKMPVALKVAFSAASDPQLIARCREEANIAQSLSHSCIVQTFSFAIAANGTPYQVMAPVEGVTLRERLAEGQIDVHERFIIAHSVLSAINHLHERGVAHRDLKPSNIFLGSGGEVKLGDFGVALAEKREIDLTRSGELLGTVGYMSPERVRGEVATPASDIFAFGLICFELLANEGVPRDTTAQRIGVDMNSMAAAILSELKRSNDPWSELIVACLAFDPQARPTAEALLARVNNEALRVPKEFLHACRARARRRTVARGTAILFVFYLFALILLRIPGMQPVLLSYAVALDVTHGPALHAGFSRLFGVTTPKSTNASLLHYFVQNGQELGARTLLQHGVSADAPDRDGTTALCGLVHDSEPALISLLLQSQADPNQRCPGGMLIAERAARDDYFALFQQLLQHGAEPTAEAIRKAIDTGSSRIIEVTLQYWGGSFERFARSDEGFLRWMLQREDQDLVEKMLARIQALSSLRVQELPPLAWAAAANRPKLVTTLIDRLHADPLATVGGIHPAWVWAINGNSIETMDALRARGFDIELNYPVYGTPLLIAVRAPQDDVLRQLLAWGVPLNAPMGNSTLLIDTALRLSPERLAKVIGLGADPAYGDISGITPLYWSILYGRWFNVPVLVSRSGWLMNFDQWLRAVRGEGS